MTSPKSGPPKALLIGVVTVLVGGAVAGAFFLGRRSGQSGDGGGTVTNLLGGERKGPPSAGAGVEGMPEPAMTALEVPGTAAPSALWVDVHHPGKVRDALAANVWLRDQLQKPLGRASLVRGPPSSAPPARTSRRASRARCWTSSRGSCWTRPSA